MSTISSKCKPPLPGNYLTNYFSISFTYSNATAHVGLLVSLCYGCVGSHNLLEVSDFQLAQVKLASRKHNVSDCFKVSVPHLVTLCCKQCVREDFLGTFLEATSQGHFRKAILRDILGRHFLGTF